MKVSVVIPTYNRYELLKRALRSVSSQTLPPDEIVVVDDGSTDNTRKIQEEFPNIRYIYQENGGVASARNRGIEVARYELIAFLDDDDVWDERKLEIQLPYHDDYAVTFCDECWIRNEKEIRVPKKYAKFDVVDFTQILSHTIIAPSSLMVHREVFEHVGVFDTSLKVCEDYDLFLRMAREYPLKFIDEKLIRKHAGHPNQLGFTPHLDRYRVEALKKHLPHPKVIYELTKKYKILLKGASKNNDSKNSIYYERQLKELEKCKQMC